MDWLSLYYGIVQLLAALYCYEHFEGFTKLKERFFPSKAIRKNKRQIKGWRKKLQVEWASIAKSYDQNTATNRRARKFSLECSDEIVEPVVDFTNVSVSPPENLDEINEVSLPLISPSMSNSIQDKRRPCGNTYFYHSDESGKLEMVSNDEDLYFEDLAKRLSFGILSPPNKLSLSKMDVHYGTARPQRQAKRNANAAGYRVARRYVRKGVPKLRTVRRRSRIMGKISRPLKPRRLFKENASDSENSFN